MIKTGSVHLMSCCPALICQAASLSGTFPNLSGEHSVVTFGDFFLLVYTFGVLIVPHHQAQ